VSINKQKDASITVRRNAGVTGSENTVENEDIVTFILSNSG
jgi:hypothetical protein